MPHIHTEDGEHDFTASAFIVRWLGGEPCILFVMHKKHHKLMQPGGHVELNETPWQAIEHELLEETGYELSQLEILQPAEALSEAKAIAMHPLPALMNTHAITTDSPLHYHTDITYGFVTDEDPLHQPHEGESTDLRWLTKQEIRQMHDDVMYENTRNMAIHVLEQTVPNWKRRSVNEFKR